MATDSERTRRAARDVTQPGSPTVLPGDADFRAQVAGSYTTDIDSGGGGGGGGTPDVTLAGRKLYIAEDLFDEIRDMLDDANADFTTESYLCRKLNLAQDMLQKELLMIPNINTMKYFVTISNVPSGTKSLTDYLGADGPLALLDEIISMKERASTGSRNDSDYSEMTAALDFDTVYNPSPGSTASLNGMYLHTGDDLLLPGSNSIEDFKILGKFVPRRIVSGDSSIPFGCEGILKFRAAELGAMARGQTTLAAAYHEYADNAQSSHIAKAVMAMQGTPVRMRPFRSRYR